jgi:helicase SWR1
VVTHSLTGADTVIFYDSDFNPQMDRQCEDRCVVATAPHMVLLIHPGRRAHRIGQMRDVHIYRFISQHTVEEAMLRKANQKRSLDDLVIQKGEFDWRSLFGDESALTKALGEFEDTEDAHAAAVAAREAVVMEGADQADFGDAEGDGAPLGLGSIDQAAKLDPSVSASVAGEAVGDDVEQDADAGEDGGGTTVDYMLAFIRFDHDFFRDWRL